MNVLYTVKKESEGIDLIMNAEELISYANDYIKSFTDEDVEIDFTLEEAVGELGCDYFGNKDFEIMMFVSMYQS
jgi:hypothetical protein